MILRNLGIMFINLPVNDALSKAKSGINTPPNPKQKENLFLAL